MRLAGRHTFNLTSGGSANWQLDREQTDETGGGSTLVRAIASAQGATASFDLPGVPGKETVYYINASGVGFTDTQRVQVFSANTRSAFVYKSAGNPDVRVFITVPASLSPATRIVMVMAGQQRDADAYLDSWIDWTDRKSVV